MLRSTWRAQLHPSRLRCTGRCTAPEAPTRLQARDTDVHGIYACSYAAGPRKPSKLARMARDVPWAIVPRKRLDVAAADLLYGIGKAVTALPSHRAGVTNELQQLWTGEDTMVTLSVR